MLERQRLKRSYETLRESMVVEAEQIKAKREADAL